jgi:hypothetical protein
MEIVVVDRDMLKTGNLIRRKRWKSTKITVIYAILVRNGASRVLIHTTSKSFAATSQILTKYKPNSTHIH